MILVSLFVVASVSASSAQQIDKQLDSLRNRVTNLESQVYFLNSQISDIIKVLREMSDIIHNNGTSSDGSSQKLFAAPGQKIKGKTLKVFQVTGTGALAMINDLDQDISSSTFGTVLYLKNRPGESYYDNQVIKIPSKKVLRQIGTFTYMTTKDMKKTVPIVEIFSK